MKAVEWSEYFDGSLAGLVAAIESIQSEGAIGTSEVKIDGFLGGQRLVARFDYFEPDDDDEADVTDPADPIEANR